MKQNLSELKKSYAELGAEIAKLETQNPEFRFAELVEGYEVKTDWKKWPNWLFFFKKEKYLGNFHIKTKNFFSSYYLWKIFETEFKMQYGDIQQFVHKQAEKNFSLEIERTVDGFFTSFMKVEDHFQSKES